MEIIGLSYLCLNFSARIDYLLYHRLCRCSAAVGGRQSFDDWCVENGKNYQTAEERRERESIFQENAELVDKLNEQYKQE